mmetsp:Transcript_20186/g.26672  ORF Transcript_20186/g.26672 Transcript_20186/m.26672 type:complete len:129 (-) Transcript_20186:118-504(-)
MTKAEHSSKQLLCKKKSPVPVKCQRTLAESCLEKSKTCSSFIQAWTIGWSVPKPTSEKVGQEKVSQIKSKSVSFHDGVRVKLIPSSKDWDQSTLGGMWYSDHDFSQFKSVAIQVFKKYGTLSPRDDET